MAKLPQLPKAGDMVAGRFRILSLLGSGGFGTVFRALQENVGREVALKFLTPGVAKDPVNVERFRREAYHVSQLRHPNTITLHDYGQTEEGLIYMVMELLEGSSLADTVQNEGALEWPRASHIFIQVLKSLSEAHQRGLVHRDLKPENIYLSVLFGEQDYIKVLDFGVAKMTMAGEEDGNEEMLTKAGRIFGTPMYMAPEQACAEPITPATDVYALGLLIFEMLTGLPPVTGRNRMDVIHKQIRDPVPVLTKVLLGTPMGNFIRKATEKKPADRYLNASEMLEAFVFAIRGMNIRPKARGATHPEISVTALVPDGLDLSDLSEDDPVSGPVPSISDVLSESDQTMPAPIMVVDPNATQPPPGMYPAPASHVDASDEFEIDSRPTKPMPPPLPSALKPSLSISPASQPTSERRDLASRMASAERRVADRPPSTPRYELPLIGREKDVLKLSSLIQENVFANSGHVIFLEGENGVGKSRTVGALKSNLRNLGVGVCVGNSRPRSIPLEPIREAIADYWGVGHAERMQVDTTIRKDLASTGDYEDAEIDRIIDFIRPRGQDETQLDTSQESVFFAQIERLLVGLSQRRQLVIVLEDIQYADSATLAFLEYFAVTLRTQSVPIVVLLSFRPEERSANRNLEESLRNVVSNVGAEYTRYVLRRLRGRDLAVLLDNILTLEGRLKERIGWLSQGVPLHAIQIVRYLQNEDSLVKKRGRWGLRKGSPRKIDLPPDLMDLMRLRIEQATSNENRSSLKATLEWLATLGMRTPVELLALVIGQGSGSLDGDLGRLRDQGIVRQALHQNLVCVEFDNSLLREAILHDLSERWANRRLHSQAAEKKIEFYRAKGMDVPLVEIAEHWRQAGENDKYRDTIFAAAQRSVQRQDLRGARERFRELTDLLEATDDTGEIWSQAQLSLAELAWRFGEYGLAEDRFKRAIQKGATKGPELGRAFRGLGHLLLMQGRKTEAQKWYQNALDWGRKHKNGRGVAKALIGLSKVHLMSSQLPAEKEVSEQLIKMLPDLPTGEISGKVQMHLADSARRRGDLATRRDYLIKARQEFETANHRPGLSDALLALGSAFMDPTMNAPNRFIEAGQMFRQALELKRSLGDRMGVAEAYRNLGQLEIETGNYANANELLGQSLSIHQALGTRYYEAAVFNAMGVSSLFTKDYATAQTQMEKSLEVFKDLGDQISSSHCLMNLGELAINSGDIAKAQTMLREARRMKESLGTSWAIYDIRNHLAIVSLWLGEFDDAEKQLEEILLTVDEHGTDEDRAVARSLMGLLRCFQSRLQLAALELGRARADAEDLGSNRVTFFCQANAAFYAGLTESESAFQGIVQTFKNEDFFYTLDKLVWLGLLRKLAMKTAENDCNRQSVRLLQTTARLHRELGFESEADKLDTTASGLEDEINDNR